MADIKPGSYRSLTPEQKLKYKAKTKRWQLKNASSLLLWHLKSRAKANNIAFNLTKEDIIIPEFCPVLGIRLEKGKGKSGFNSPSVDRIIPSLGYTKGNIVIISQRANLIKNDATPDEIQRVATFYKNLEEERNK